MTTKANLRNEHIKIIEKINKYVNDFYKTSVPKDKIFGIKCLHNSNSLFPVNIFLSPGYNNGIIDSVTLWNEQDTKWMTQLIYMLDIEQVNLYLINWDSTGLKYITPNRGVLYDLYKASFPGSYNNAEITGSKLAKFLTIFNHKGDNKVILIGHSLGSKIILNCLNNLYNMGYYKGKKYPIVDLAILLGTTEFVSNVNTNNISKTTIYKSVNVYNTADKILIYIVGIFYQMSLFNIYNVVGLSSLSKFHNINCMRQINWDDKKRCNNGKCITNTNYGHNYTTIIWWIFSHKVIRQYNIIPFKNLEIKEL